MSGGIEAVYGAFACYPRPKTFRACTCCIPDSGGKYGKGETAQRPAPGGDAPLREVSAEELCAFAENVPGTCGDLASFKHYLPRILELAKPAVSSSDDEFPDLGTVLPKLAHGDDAGFVPWWEWAEDERVAIREYLHDEWRSVCGSQDPHETAGFLAGLLNADPDIDSYLEAWADAQVDRLLRVEAMAWIERPSAEYSPEFARPNWAKVRAWVAAQN